MKKIVYLISIFFVSFLCIRNVEAASASKTNYDSKCSYKVEIIPSSFVNVNIYFADGKDAFWDYDENSGLMIQHPKEINTDSSISCPQLKFCSSSSSGFLLYPNSNYACPQDTGDEKSISSNGARQYNSSYKGDKEVNTKPCTTTYTINNDYYEKLNGKKMEINLYPASQASKRKLEIVLDGQKYDNIGSNPNVTFSSGGKSINVGFESKEVDTIYKTLNETGKCSFHVRKEGSGNDNIMVLHLTTKEVESQESITGKTEKPIIDIDDLSDKSWSNEDDGCTALKGSQTIIILRQILNYLQLAAVALLLVLGSLDFAGAVMSDKDDAMKQAGNKFVKRLIAAVIVFLVPVLVNIVLFIADKSESVCGLLG